MSRGSVRPLLGDVRTRLKQAGKTLARPQRDVLAGFPEGECVELATPLLRLGVHLASGGVVSVFDRQTQREHLLVRIGRADAPQPQGLADAGTAPPRGAWRIEKRSKNSLVLSAQADSFLFTRTFRLLAGAQAEVRTRIEHRGRRAPGAVQLAFRAPVVPAGGGIHGYTTTSHFAHRLFIRTDTGLVEQQHRKYSNSRYEWAYPTWAAFLDTLRGEGLAFIFTDLTPVIAVNHDWNEMVVEFRSPRLDLSSGSAEYAFRIVSFRGLRRVHHQFAVGAGLVIVVEEPHDGRGRRNYALFQQRLVTSMVIGVQHHPDEFRAGHPFPFVPAASLQRVFPLLHRLPAIDFVERIAPELHTLDIVGRIIEAEVVVGSIDVDGQEIVDIHAEQGFQHLEIAAGAHTQVGQSRVLPPVARSPAAVIGVAGLAGGGDIEN